MISQSIFYILFSFLLFIFSCQQQATEENAHTAIPSARNQTIDSLQTPQQSAPASSVRYRAYTNRDSTIYASRSNAITRAVKEVSPAVVSITVTEVRQVGRRPAYDEYYDRFFFAPIEREFSSMGSGFIINEDGLIVTNEHVANENAERIVISLPDGSQYEAEIIGADKLADLALLRIKADRRFPFIEFGNSDEVIVGEWSLAIGNPFGLFKAAKPSVTVGVVSAVHRDFRPNPDEPRVYLDMIQTDAAINRGNSGGPLVNSRGEVIGINTFIYTGGTSGGFVGLGFAIPSNRARKIIEQLSTSGEVHVSYNPGFETTEMTYQLAVRYGLPLTGLFVTNVNKDGPAFQAGILPGDIILKIGQEWIQSKMHMMALFREYQEGDTMRVELWRNDQRYEAKMKLRQRVTESSEQ